MANYLPGQISLPGYVPIPWWKELLGKTLPDNYISVFFTGYTEKTTLVGSDILLINDSQDGYSVKKVQLSNISTGSTTQIQSDWNQTNITLPDYIKNKITQLSQLSDDSTHRLVTDTQIGIWNAGSTGVSLTTFNTYTGVTAPTTFANLSSYNIYTGTTAPATFLNKSFTSHSVKSSLVANDILIINDSQDSNNPKYILYSTISGTSSGQVQSDWNQTNISLPDFIKNKPTVPTQLSQLSDDSTHRLVTDVQIGTWNSQVSLSIFNTYTGTTAPSTYVSLTNYNIYTGSTVPSTYLTINTFDTYTGTTIPNNYVLKSFISYTGKTNLVSGDVFVINDSQDSNNIKRVTLADVFSGFTQVQSDWNQTGTTLPDYIKNKPSLLTLGETASTAYRGDRGKIAYDHSQIFSGNPHGSSAGDLSAVTLSSYNTYTGTTAPSTYVSLSTYHIFTGQTYFRVVSIKVMSDIDILTTGTGKVIWTVPSELNSYQIINVGASITSTGSTQPSAQIQITNLTTTFGILSTQITIDSGQTTSYASGTQPVINSLYKVISTGNQLSVDVNTAGINLKGLQINIAISV